MNVSNAARSQLSKIPGLNKAIDFMCARINNVFAVEHDNETGVHTNITATSVSSGTIAATGASTLNGTVTVNANLFVLGTTTAPHRLAVDVDGTGTTVGEWGATAGYNIGVFQNRQPIWVGNNGNIEGQVGFWSGTSAVGGATPVPSSTIGLLSGVMDYNNGYAGGHYFHGGSLAIPDGITAPTATAGRGKIYIDTADGDLKIIFGDGTVKTIATNP